MVHTVCATIYYLLICESINAALCHNKQKHKLHYTTVKYLSIEVMPAFVYITVMLFMLSCSFNNS